MSNALDNRWMGWVKENLDRKCDPEQILGILLKNNFALGSIRKAMGEQFPQNSPQIAAQPPEPAISANHQALCEVSITRLGPESGIKRLEDARVQLYTLDHFMTEKECDALVKIIRKTLRPSTVTVESTDKYFRTSTTSDLSLLKHPSVEALDKKISRMLGICMPYSEGIQAQRYEVGQQFKTHTDFFEPRTEEYEKYATKAGNRTWTFMVYLNDTTKGGGTHFVKLDKIFYPKKGQALIWNNLHVDGTPNRETAHCGMPVEEGEKIIITKWYREKGKGPMFYEDRK